MTKKSDLLQTEMSCRRTIFSLDLRQVRPIFCHFPYACIGMALRRSSSFLPVSSLPSGHNASDV